MRALELRGGKFASLPGLTLVPGILDSIGEDGRKSSGIRFANVRDTRDVRWYHWWLYNSEAADCRLKENEIPRKGDVSSDWTMWAYIPVAQHELLLNRELEAQGGCSWYSPATPLYDSAETGSVTFISFVYFINKKKILLFSPPAPRLALWSKGLGRVGTSQFTSWICGDD